MGELKRKSVFSLLWDLAGKLGLQGVGFFVSLVLARLLTPEDFGILAIVMVFINLANIFLDMGFNTALIQKPEIDHSHYSTVFFINISAGLILSFLVYSSAPYISSFYEREELKDIIRFLSLSFVISSFGNVTKAYLKRQLNFRIITYSSIPAAILSGAVALFLAYKGYGVWSLVVQVLLGHFFGNLFLYILSPIHFVPKMDKNAVKELWAFSYNMFRVGVLNSIFLNVDTLIIGKLLSPGGLGYYQRAKSLESFSYKYTGDAISNVLFASLSSLQHDIVKMKHSVEKIFHILCFLSFFICGLLFVNAHDIIIILFSQKWEPSVPIFRVIIFGAFITQIGTLFYNVILSTGDTRMYSRLVYKNYVFHFLNFGVLLIGDLLTYLGSMLVIKLGVMLLSVRYAKRIIGQELRYEKYLLSYFFTYIISIGLFYAISKYFFIEEIYFRLACSSLTYGLIFMLASFILQSRGLISFFAELKLLLRSNKR